MYNLRNYFVSQYSYISYKECYRERYLRLFWFHAVVIPLQKLTTIPYFTDPIPIVSHIMILSRNQDNLIMENIILHRETLPTSE